jgi:carbon-monoxide dehydrogenase large subunit
MLYDDEGNPLATTFMDYLIPTAVEVPVIEYSHIETPSNSPGGFKGVGEGGAIGAPACVFNAIADALSLVGAQVFETPLGPRQVLDALGERAVAPV